MGLENLKSLREALLKEIYGAVDREITETRIVKSVDKDKEEEEYKKEESRLDDLQLKSIVAEAIESKQLNVKSLIEGFEIAQRMDSTLEEIYGKKQTVFTDNFVNSINSIESFQIVYPKRFLRELKDSGFVEMLKRIDRFAQDYHDYMRIESNALLRTVFELDKRQEYTGEDLKTFRFEVEGSQSQEEIQDIKQMIADLKDRLSGVEEKIREFDRGLQSNLQSTLSEAEIENKIKSVESSLIEFIESRVSQHHTNSSQEEEIEQLKRQIDLIFEKIEKVEGDEDDSQEKEIEQLRQQITSLFERLGVYEREINNLNNLVRQIANRPAVDADHILGMIHDLSQKVEQLYNNTRAEVKAEVKSEFDDEEEEGNKKPENQQQNQSNKKDSPIKVIGISVGALLIILTIVIFVLRSIL